MDMRILSKPYSSACNRSCPRWSHGQCFGYDCPNFEKNFPTQYKTWKEEQVDILDGWLAKNVKYVSDMLRRKK